MREIPRGALATVGSAKVGIPELGDDDTAVETAVSAFETCMGSIEGLGRVILREPYRQHRRQWRNWRRLSYNLYEPTHECPEMQ